MKLVRCLLVAFVAAFPTAGSSAVVQFTAPAGNAPAGHRGGAIFDAVLPSGRIVTPLGSSAVTGQNALGFAVSPDGRFAIVSNDDDGSAGARSAVDPNAAGGYSLATVDLATMRVASRFALPGETYFAGVAVVRDPRRPGGDVVFAAGGSSDAVYVLDLGADGRLTADAAHVISIDGALDAAFDGSGRSAPAALVGSADGRRVYAIDERGGTVTAIDTARRAVSGAAAAVGFLPFGAALAGDRLVVGNEGLMRYARVADPPLLPPFGSPPADLARASSLSFVELAPHGDLAPAPAAALPMDPAPDGLRVVGGAHPAAIAVTADGAYAFVAMTNVDRIASVALRNGPRVVGGTELRLFDRGPYGTQPAALALSRDGTRLYVALAGLNAVAVLDARDPLHLHRLGLLPTGWAPCALELSADDRTLYVLNTNGFGHDLGAAGNVAPDGDAQAVWSTLQKIDLSGVTLAAATATALTNTRAVQAAAPHYPSELTSVVVIVQEAKSFDAMLGDLGSAPADSSLVRFGAAVTPNMHALARRFALAGNLFADAAGSDRGHQFILNATAPPFTLRAALWASRPDFDAGTGQDPEDVPRTGSIFTSLSRHAIPFRDYGDALRLAGYDDGAASDPRVDDPDFAGVDDRAAPTRGLGGRYAASVPAPVVLAGHVDPDYPGWNLRIRDERRAREFVRDYAALVRAHREPRYTQIALPDDRTGSGPDIPPPAEEVADGDRALGTIVAYLSRLPSWRHTAIFVLPDDAYGSPDHVDAARAYALVISPFAKRGYLGMRHLSTVSVLKTAEQILALPPIGLGDLLATDMADFFTPAVDPRPYAALAVPAQAAVDPGRPASRN